MFERKGAVEKTRHGSGAEIKRRRFRRRSNWLVVLFPPFLPITHQLSSEKLNLLVAHFKSSINPTLKRKSGRQEVKPKKQGGGRGGEWGLGGDGVSPEEKEGLVVRVAFDFENEDFEEVCFS